MISVIIPVGRNEPWVRKQINDIKQTIGDVDHEILVISLDESVCLEAPDVRICQAGPMNPAEARNYAARMARGDIFVFSDAHTEFGFGRQSKRWGEVLSKVFSLRSIGVASFPRYTLTGDIRVPERHKNMIARGLAFNSDMNLLNVRYIKPQQAEIPFVWGDFHAISRRVFDDVRGYITEGGGHFEDRTMCVTCTLFGYRNICIEDSSSSCMIGAYIRPPGSLRSFPYWYYGNMAFGALHYTGERLERFKNFWIKDGHSAQEFEIVFDRWKPLREYYLKRRVYDDNWYFNTFLQRWI